MGDVLSGLLDDPRHRRGRRPVSGLRRFATIGIARPATANATVTAHNPTIVAESNYPDGSRSIETGSVGYRSKGTSSDQGDEQEYSGRPAQNEEGVLDICHALREVVGRDEVGAFTERAEHEREEGVDAVASRADGTLMRVQVTRVEHSVWRDVAQQGTATTQYDPISLADNIRTAIESKCNIAERGRLVFALDARRAPGYLFDTVIEDFRNRHGEWVRTLGFEAVWLVGPAAMLTYRLA